MSRIDQLNISENSATEIGGGICCKESLELDALVSLSVTENLVGKEGGGLHAKTVNISNLKSGFSFSNNKANSSSTGVATTASAPAAAAASLQAAAAAAPSSPATPTYSGVVGGAIYGEKVTFSQCSRTCQFSGNQAIDNNPSQSSLNVQGGAIYAKTSLSIGSSDAGTSYIFSGTVSPLGNLKQQGK